MMPQIETMPSPFPLLASSSTTAQPSQPTGQLERIQGTSLHYIRPDPPKPHALEEDAYITSLSSIIQRDFFPSLTRLRTQNAFLDATLSPSLSSASEARRLGLQIIASPSLSQSSETPTTRSMEGGEAVATNMSLDTYQSTYTSQDNASFTQLLHDSNHARAQRYAWVYDQEKNRLSLSKPESFRIGSSNEDGLRANPHGFIEGWEFKARNPLMYYPDGFGGEDQTRVQGTAKRAINHSATRFVSSSTPTTLPQNVSTAVPESPYTYIPSTPLLTSTDISADALMTWGEIQSTPLRLDTGPAYTLPETPKRDVLGMRLSNDIGRKLREKREISKRSRVRGDEGEEYTGSGSVSGRSVASVRSLRSVASSRSMSGRSTLSNAGRMLLEKKTGKGNGEFGAGFGDTVIRNADLVPFVRKGK